MKMKITTILILFLLSLRSQAVLNANPDVLISYPASYSAIAGGSIHLQYRWFGATATPRALTAFVHFVNSSGQIVFQDDHAPVIATNQWSGEIRYYRNVQIPASLPPGTYTIRTGLYDSQGRSQLNAGPGVTDDGTYRYTIATLNIVNVAALATNLNVAVSGQTLSLQYNWQSTSGTQGSKNVFVHFVDLNGDIVFQDDHTPPTSTQNWNGRISYSRSIKIPASLPLGEYGIYVGLYDQNGRLPIAPSAETFAVGDRIVVGQLLVTNNASTSTQPNFVSNQAHRTRLRSIQLDGVANAVPGGEGFFQLESPCSTSIRDPGTVINSSAGTNSCWHRQYTGGRNVKWYGAYGDGIHDDTSAVQSAINQGGLLIFPPGDYLISNVSLVSNLVISAEQATISQSGSISGLPYSMSAQTSARPLFSGNQLQNIKISANIDNLLFEAILLFNSQNISISALSINGIAKSIFPAINIYGSSNISLSNFQIQNTAPTRTDADNYVAFDLHLLGYQNSAVPTTNKLSTDRYGDALTLQGDSGIVISNCLISNSAGNGIFLFGVQNVTVTDCTLTQNNLSGLQLAGSGNSNLNISENQANFNMADAFDINLRGVSARTNLDLLISNNVTLSNGRVGFDVNIPGSGSATPDGAGIATLVNLNNFKIANNQAAYNAKSGVYCEGCGEGVISENTTDGDLEILTAANNTDQDNYSLDISNNNFVAPSMNQQALILNTTGHNINFISNNFAGVVSLASPVLGTDVNSIVFQSNRIQTNIRMNVVYFFTNNSIVGSNSDSLVYLAFPNFLANQVQNIGAGRAMFVENASTGTYISQNTFSVANAASEAIQFNGVLVQNPILIQNTMTNISPTSTQAVIICNGASIISESNTSFGFAQTYGVFTGSFDSDRTPLGTTNP